MRSAQMNRSPTSEDPRSGLTSWTAMSSSGNGCRLWDAGQKLFLGVQLGTIDPLVLSMSAAVLEIFGSIGEPVFWASISVEISDAVSDYLH